MAVSDASLSETGRVFNRENTYLQSAANPITETPQSLPFDVTNPLSYDPLNFAHTQQMSGTTLLCRNNYTAQTFRVVALTLIVTGGVAV